MPIIIARRKHYKIKIKIIHFAKDKLTLGDLKKWSKKMI